MKTSIFLALALIASPSSFALTQTEVFKLSSPKVKLRDASVEGLGISRDEARDKEQILGWKKNRPEKYQSLKENPNPFFDEIQAGLEKVEPAKILAKYHLFRHADKKWTQLKDSAFLNSASDKWSEAKVDIKRSLEKIVLVPTTSKTHFRFEVPWGSALVKKDLSEVQTSVSVADHLEGNRLPEGAENIKFPEDR